MKNLLVVTSVFEALIGVAMIIAPAPLVLLLVGTMLDSPGGLLVARVAGAAALALGLLCWLARNDGQSCAARGIVAAMLLYNLLVVTLLVYAGLGIGLPGIGLWPAVFVHVALAVWCISWLRPADRSDRGRGA